MKVIEPLLLIKLTDQKENPRFQQVINQALNGVLVECLDDFSKIAGKSFKNRKILLAISIDESGINFEYYKLLQYIRENKDIMANSLGVILVDGQSEIYTKALAIQLALAANMAGCAFIGKGLVEATKSLANFNVAAKNHNCDNLTAYKITLQTAVIRLLQYSYPKTEKPNILVLHASSHSTSNTMEIYKAVKENIKAHCTLTEIGLRNGTIFDCCGCPYTTCLHFGEKASCFYGGVMAGEVYPALQTANAVIMLAPNYNDSISANLTACINRLTALYRSVQFYDKALFSIVVSGYSGGDILAKQLIAAMNMNKGFYLPEKFTMIETANKAGEAMELEGIEGRINEFSQSILKTLFLDS